MTLNLYMLSLPCRKNVNSAFSLLSSSLRSLSGAYSIFLYHRGTDSVRHCFDKTENEGLKPISASLVLSRAEKTEKLLAFQQGRKPKNYQQIRKPKNYRQCYVCIFKYPPFLLASHMTRICIPACILINRDSLVAFRKKIIRFFQLNEEFVRFFRGIAIRMAIASLQPISLLDFFFCRINGDS